MARKAKIQPWPWRIRGLYIVLGVSLILNVGLISGFVLLNSRAGDYSLSSLAINHICSRDYSWFMNGSLSKTTQNERILLSEQYCNRDITTGKFLNGTISNGHYHL